MFRLDIPEGGELFVVFELFVRSHGGAQGGEKRGEETHGGR